MKMSIWLYPMVLCVTCGALGVACNLTDTTEGPTTRTTRTTPDQSAPPVSARDLGRDIAPDRGARPSDMASRMPDMREDTPPDQSEAPDMAPVEDIAREMCAPKTCADVPQAWCGDIDDGCGATIPCGCTAPETCGAVTPDVCGCVPNTTCADAPNNCGMLDNGCGTMLDCGPCQAMCTGDFQDCDNDPTTGVNGCETDVFSRRLSSNLNHCGGCNRACPPNSLYCFQGDCYD